MTLSDYNTVFKHSVIVVDTETSGLNPHEHIPVEVAWWRLSTDECGVFVPPHDVDKVLETGDPRALEINQYRERIMPRPQDTDGSELLRLGKALHLNTWAGANPAFDVSFLAPLFAAAGFPPRFWHYRLWDVCAYAAGKLDLGYIPGLFEVCKLLELPTPDHGAQNDVVAAGRCLLKLRSGAL